MNKICPLCCETGFEFAYNKIMGYYAFCVSCEFKTDYFGREADLKKNLSIFKEEDMAFELIRKKYKLSTGLKETLENAIYIRPSGFIVLGKNLLDKMGKNNSFALFFIDKEKGKIISNKIHIKLFDSLNSIDNIDFRRHAFKLNTLKSQLGMEAHFSVILKEFDLEYFDGTSLSYKIDKKKNIEVDLTDLIKNKKERKARQTKTALSINQDL